MAQSDAPSYLNGMAHMLKLNSTESGYMFEWRSSQKLPDSLRTGQQLLFQGSVHSSKNELNRTAYYWEKAPEKDLKMHGLTGCYYLQQLNDPVAALRHYNLFDAQTPDFDDIEGNDPISIWKGKAYAMLGNHAETVRQFDKGIGGIENKHGAEWVNYRFFVARAVSYLALKQPEPALADLAKALKNYDRSAIARFYQGVAYQQMGRIAEAQEAYNDTKFRMQYIRYQQGNYNEGLIYDLYEGQIDDALKALKP